MTKRNTEGYVLAYLLIVITVMGVIAATLMTSTLQVVQAQEKSLVYMQEKYEAMGEVERLLATLESDIESTTASDFVYETFELAEKAAKNAFISFVESYSIPNPDDDSWKNWETGIFSSYLSEDGEHCANIELKNDSIMITASIQLLLNPSEFKVDIDYDDDIPNPEHENWEEGNGEEPPETITRYSYDIKDVNFQFVSYKITSNGGDT